MAMVASPSCPPPPPQFHVLAVDDSVLDRKLIERLLRTSSYHVTAVDSVTKALEFLGMQHHQGGATTTSSSCSSSSTTSSSSAYLRHQQEINLIITDYCMPGMTGYDLLKTVKGSGSPLKDIPVVIMSSENVPARINRCLEEGADEFLLKPVKLSDMSKLRPRVLKGETQTTSNTNHGDDKEVGTTGNQGMLQEHVSTTQVEVMELPHEQILLLGRQVLDCATASDEAAAAAVAGDAASDVDSPRSNKRKAVQGNGAVSIQDHRARTTTTVTTTASSSSRSTVASLFVL